MDDPPGAAGVPENMREPPSMRFTIEHGTTFIRAFGLEVFIGPVAWNTTTTGRPCAVRLQDGFAVAFGGREAVFARG